MNIEDVDRIPTVKGCPLEMIFERQRALHNKYQTIEVRNGVGYFMVWGRGFHIDDTKSQYYVKDLTWRVIEELAEAAEALGNHEEIHAVEELADAFHFLVELCIVVKMTPNKIIQGKIDSGSADRLTRLFNIPPSEKEWNSYQTNYMFWRVTEELGLACNCLKNKPWKQTHMETDKRRFEKHLRWAFKAFIHLCAYVGLNKDDLFSVYFKKSEVNKFRIRSQY
jgi:dimeric dUTPase (all-alpha-NTP-PPase superfamily)